MFRASYLPRKVSPTTLGNCFWRRFFRRINIHNWQYERTRNVHSECPKRPLPIQCAEFQARRNKFVSLIRKASSTFPHLLVCVPASRTVFMAKDVPFPFRQNSDFRYLCGQLDPDSLLVIHSFSPTEYKSHLFMPTHSEEDNRWHGSLSSESSIKENSGVDFVHPISDLEVFLEATVKSIGTTTSVGIYSDPTNRFSSYSRLDDHLPSVFSAVDDFILQKPSNCSVLGKPSLYVQECRLTKSPAEAALMKHACEISCEAMKDAMCMTRSGLREKQVEAAVSVSCINGGADRLSFPPVCAGGNRATTIHYIKNSSVLQPGETLLVDSGCEVDGYCSDMTRVWPVDLDCSASQAKLLEIVLWVQQTIIARLVKLGNDYSAYPTLDNLQHQMLELLARQLRQNEIIVPKTSDTSKDTALVSNYFCGHHVSHYLGMDVHDCSDISRSRPLQQGMVFTVEPGVYIPDSSPLAASSFWSTGVRIEDDIYLGPEGPEILTKNCPSDPESIKNLRVGNKS